MSDLFSTPSLLAFLVAIAIGVGMMVALRFAGSSWRINASEFGLVLVVMFVVSQPAVGAIGTKVARDNAVSGYVEFINGSMDQVPDPEVTRCDRDGRCKHTYDCDPYKKWEVVGYKTEYYTDSKGKRQSRSVPVYDWVTHWHSCPFASEELTYKARGNFGFMVKWYTFARNIFAPNARPWRGDRALPGNVPREVPPAWAAARQHWQAGFPDPVTTTGTYTNYLLAVQDDVLRQHSSNIEKYRKAGLLPTHTQNLHSAIFDGYKAKKFTFVGNNDVEALPNDAERQDALARLNARFGMERQGDLHVVAVPASRVGEGEADQYGQALIAYWQGRDFGKYGLSKNGVVLVVGVDDARQKVVWARGKTGVPIGNNEMLTAFALQLPGQAFEPRSFLGWPGRGPDDKGKMVYRPSGGAVENILFGDHGFARPCMDCKDKEDKGTPLNYLKSSAFISTGAKFWIGFFRVLVAVSLFLLVAWLPLFEGARNRTRSVIRDVLSLVGRHQHKRRFNE